MCEPLYPARFIVIIQSSFDNKFWIIKSDKSVRKVDIEELISELKDCYNSTHVSICPNEGKILIWSRNGYSAIGVEKADLFSDDTWCNINKFAELVNERLREPITPSLIDRAKEELLWMLGAQNVSSLRELVVET